MALTHTKGFKRPDARTSHWYEHHRKMAIVPANETVYELMADAFFGPRPAVVAEGTRRNGDLIRYDPRTEHFGIVNGSGYVLTFFRADKADRPFSSGTNPEYFVGELKK